MPAKTTLDSTIESIVSRAAADIAAAVRADIGAQVRQVLGAGTTAAATPRKGRAAPTPSRAAASSASRRNAGGGRRTSEQVAADDGRLLSYIKAHPTQRSEEIQKGLGLPKQNVASGLIRLREAGSVRMKGIKRAATYTAS